MRDCSLNVETLIQVATIGRKLSCLRLGFNGLPDLIFQGLHLRITQNSVASLSIIQCPPARPNSLRLSTRCIPSPRLPGLLLNRLQLLQREVRNVPFCTGLLLEFGKDGRMTNCPLKLPIETACPDSMI